MSVEIRYEYRTQKSGQRKWIVERYNRSSDGPGKWNQIGGTFTNESDAEMFIDQQVAIRIYGACPTCGKPLATKTIVVIRGGEETKIHEACLDEFDLYPSPLITSSLQRESND